MNIRRSSWILIVGCLWLFACAGRQAEQTAPAQVPGAQAAARPTDKYIFITPKTLDGVCYRTLGPVSFKESFLDATTDPDSAKAAHRLRSLAAAKYPGTEAIIDAKSHQNDMGTVITVSGEAVALENHTTMSCALHGMTKVLDTAAMLAAAGAGGATIGGLMTSSAVPAAAVAGAGAAMGAVGGAALVYHQNQEEAQAKELQSRLTAQRQEIDSLLGERARLRQCQAEELNYKNCLAAKPTIEITKALETGPAKGNATLPASSTFEIERQIQEQQDYIDKLKQQVDDLRTQMSY